MVVLIGLIALTLVLFGTGAADGPLQVALFMSATFAGVVAYKNGHTAAAIEEAAVGGVASAMVMGGLALSRVRYDRFLRFLAPLLLILLILTCLFMLLGVAVPALGGPVK